MGFHYDSNEFFYKDLITQYNVFISANSKLHYNNPIKKTKEKGLYLCVYCNAHYGVIDSKIKERILKFVEQNKLHIMEAYIFSRGATSGLLLSLRKNLLNSA